MYSTRLVYLFLLLFIKVFISETVRINVLNGQWKESEVEATVINQSIMNGTGFAISRYYSQDDQITRIEDLPDLDLVVIADVGQEISVTFSNVPKFRALNLSKNKIIYLPATAFGNTDLERTWLFGNKIKIIEDGAFGNNLKVLSMYCNEVKVFRPKWFKNPKILTDLDVRGNMIRELKEDSFKEFINLNVLKLSFNQIFTIGEGAFAGRNSFDLVLLAHNHVKVLRDDVFKEGKINFDYLDLRYSCLFITLTTLNLNLRATI